ncbi:potassium channel family protein [Litorisediminicola beolgyonensis]|uniref:Potassium channel family protein n=1 Tax=Litorisediminicola beolgyonensis TaxID=1173614 RepID=A0ABW3ZN20_9RHOB
MTGERIGETGVRERIKELYEGDSEAAHRFRYALLGFDLVTIAFVIATSFVATTPAIIVADVIFGLGILAEFLARLWIAERRWRFIFSLGTLIDAASIVAFLAPLTGQGLGFVRVLRTLRLLRSYQLLERIGRDIPALRARHDEILATLNLAVFIFVMTGLVYATQFRINDQINNYADALYFTVTALTTTGFGDITLEGTVGRLISVVVMFFGVTLFLRLAQVLFRPRKVRETCKRCGLSLHDPDAVHCKHCGKVIHIETEGET